MGIQNGSKGYRAISNDGGYKSWRGQDQEPGPSAGETEEDHFANFIACVKSRKKEELRAPSDMGPDLFSRLRYSPGTDREERGTC